MKTTLRPALLLPLLALAGGCGIELVGGAQHGDVEAVMTDDSGAGGSAPMMAIIPGHGYSSSNATPAAVVSGTVRANIAVALLHPNGRVETISPGAVEGAVRIGTGETVRLGLARIESGVYPRIRVTITRAEAQLDVGVTGIGGVLLEGTVIVDLGQQPLVLEIPLEVTVHAHRPLTLAVDLNAAAWVIHADPVTRRVPAAALQSAIEVRAE